MTGTKIKSVAVAVSTIQCRKAVPVMNPKMENQRIDSKTQSLTVSQCKLWFWRVGLAHG